MSNIVVTNKQIQTRLKEIAKEINSKYDEITLLVTLTGGVYTAIDLSKYINIPCKMEFVKISSYGNSKESGLVELKWISVNKGQHLGNVLIIDDIFDTGKTMDYLLKYLLNNYTFTSLDTMVLLDKPKRRVKQNKITYTGFVIDDLFVYGYGLDLNGEKRNLTDIFFV